MSDITTKRTHSHKHWWEPIEESLASVRLKGLRVECPKCGEKGLVFSRWIKGPSLKPLYMLHIKWKKVRKVCEINKKQSENIRSQISIPESDIETLMECKKTYVLFSGGKDSLATLAYLKKIAKKVKKDITAIFVDTTVGIQENMKYVKNVCKYLNVELKVVKPKVDYFTLAKEWGIPSFGFRWCCRELKIKPIEDYLKDIKEQKIVFDGIRATESRIRKKYIPIWYHPSFKCLSASPIFYWSNQDVISFINSDGIPKNLLHSLGTSSECWCGAYKREEDFKKLYELDREMFYKLAKLEEENKSGYTYIYKSGKKISLRKLEQKILNENKNLQKKETKLELNKSDT